ncbi:MAG: hypothetical protein WC712_07145 [Candidatus Brocadiia bacterium]
MKSQSKPILISFLAATALSVLLYFVLIGPKLNSVSTDMKKVDSTEAELKRIAGENGMVLEQITDLYDSKQALTEDAVKNLVSFITFATPPEYEVVKNSKTALDFPVDRNKVVGEVREKYPGFPFDPLMGLPQQPSGDPALLQDYYIRLAVCRRLLEILGEANVDNVLKLTHNGDSTIKSEAAKCSMYKKFVTVSFEGRIPTLVAALRSLSLPGQYMRIENVSLHPSRSGYSLGCDLRVSVISVTLEEPESLVPTPTPEPSTTPQPSTEPLPSGAPPVSPAPGSPAPPPSVAPTPAPPKPSPTSVAPTAII